MIKIGQREKQILFFLHLPTKQIAHILGIAPSTIYTYLKRMFIKFNVNNRTALYAKAQELNLIARQENDERRN